MDHTIQPPLSLYFGFGFGFGSQTKSVETLVAANVAEHGFDDRHAMAVYLLASRTVDPLLHPVGITGL